MLKFIKENIEILCIRPRSDSELEKTKKKQDNEILKSAELIHEYECSNCFIPTLSKEEFIKTKINNNLFGFCSETCYEHIYIEV